MYDSIYEAWVREKQNTKLQKLPRDFYSKLTKYIKEMKGETRMLDQNSTKAKLLKREFQNTKNAILDLVRLRHNKIVNIAVAGKTVTDDFLTEKEEEIYKLILSSA